MSIDSGCYIITNVRQKNVAYVADPNEGSPLAASSGEDTDRERWDVRMHRNGRYIIQNICHGSYANSGTRALEEATVEGRLQEQEWVIQETRVRKQYTIATSDTHLMWGLLDNQLDTPITLSSKSTDTRNWWTFTNPEIGPPVNEDVVHQAVLFELKPPPINPFSPLIFDFVVVQEMSGDPLLNASMAIKEVCGPLVSESLQPDALRISVIEFKSLGLNNVSLQRFSDFITFERLSNVRLQDIRWVRWRPDRGINGLRADAMKVTILNLAVIPLQRGGQAIIELINRLFQQDISLVLTPIQPTWGDDFYDSDIFQELEKISSGPGHFLNEGRFLDYVVDYNQMVAPPRPAEHSEWNEKRRRQSRQAIIAELHRPTLLRISKVPTDNAARSAAIAALSKVAQYRTAARRAPIGRTTEGQMKL